MPLAMPRPLRAVHSVRAWHVGALQRLSDLLALEPTGVRAHVATPALRGAGGAAPPPSGAAASVTESGALDHDAASLRLGALLQDTAAAATPMAPTAMTAQAASHSLRPSPEEDSEANDKLPRAAAREVMHATILVC